MKHLAVLFLLLLTACGSLQEQYVDQDQNTFDVVAPQIRAWLKYEPGLTLQDPKEVEDWERKLNSWEFRLKKAKELVESEKQGD